MNDLRETVLTKEEDTAAEQINASVNVSKNRLLEKSNNSNNSGKKFKRRYVTRSCWTVTLLIIILSFIFLNPFIALILSFSLVGLSALVNILTLFISSKKQDFSFDAYGTIVTSYCIALVTLIIFPLDISTSLTAATNSANSANTANMAQSSIHASIDLTWKITYWTSISVNFLLMKFQIAYWSQAHPTIRQRIFCTLKVLFKKILIVAIFSLSVLTFLLLKYLSLMKGLEMLKSVIQTINLIYCLAHIIVLLGYGLVQLPFYFFSYTNTGVKLKISLKALSKTRDEMEIGVNKLLKDKVTVVEICSQFIKKEKEINSDKANTLKFVKDIVQELVDYKFEFSELIRYRKVEGDIKEQNFTNIVKEVDDYVLANMLITIKQDYYYCCKKEAALLRIYSNIASNCEVVDEKFVSNVQNSAQNSGVDIFNNDPNITNNSVEDNINININTSIDQQQRRTSSVVVRRSSSFNNNKKIYFLLPKIQSICITILTKLISLVLILLSLCFLAFQINLFFLSDINFIYTISTKLLRSDFFMNYFFIFFYCSYIFICCFYSLSQFKLFEIYILVPHHTNKFGMAFNASMCNTLILGIFYNILYFFSVIYDQDYKNLNAHESASALNNFFNAMKRVEFVYGNYRYFFPALLIIVVLVTIIRKFKLFSFIIGRLNDLEIETDPIMDKGDNQIISEDFFKGEKEKVKFDVLEMIEKIYFAELNDQ